MDVLTLHHFNDAIFFFYTDIDNCLHFYIKFRRMEGAGGLGVRLYDGPDLKLFILVGWGRSFLSVAWPTGVQLMFFFSSGVSKLFGAQGSPSSGSLLNL